MEFWAAFGALAALIAGVGTVAALLIAFYQISSERSARRKDEMAALGRERIAQAQRISAWIGGHPATPIRATEGKAMPTFATLLNASHEPVYRVVVWLVSIQGAAPRTGEEMQKMEADASRMLGAVPPGTFVVSLPGDWGGMHRHPGVEIAFADAAGLHWIRRGSGALEEIPNDPLDHYGISLPVDWHVPIPAA